jgi:hypothetical protein
LKRREREKKGTRKQCLKRKRIFRQYLMRKAITGSVQSEKLLTAGRI